MGQKVVQITPTVYLIILVCKKQFPLSTHMTSAMFLSQNKVELQYSFSYF
jgi:hypothetical protein